MDLQERIFNILYDTQLSWEVQKKALKSVDGDLTDSFGIFKKGGKHIGTVGDRYVPYQNSQLAEHFLKACDTIGITTVRGGELIGGRKVYLQGKIKDALVGTDTLQRYITCLNSHDGSTAIAFGSSQVTVICQNTFYRAYKGEGMEKFKHTVNAEEKINFYVSNLTGAMENDKLLTRSLRTLATVVPEEKHFKAIYEKLFKVDMDSTAEVSTRKKNKIEEVTSIIKNKGINVHGNSLWGILSGITYYTTHEFPKRADATEYNMIGAGKELSNLCYETLMELIEEPVLV